MFTRKRLFTYALAATALAWLWGCDEASLTEDNALDIEEATSAIGAQALAVITTNELMDAPSSLIGAYAAFKRQTQSTYIVTEDKVYLENGVVEQHQGWGEGLNLTLPPSYDTASDRADAIREWLQNRYVELGIGYVLLIGDPDPNGGDVPMKNLYPMKHYSEVALVNPDLWEIPDVQYNCLEYPIPASYAECDVWRDYQEVGAPLPTDYYYSNLTFNWPVDADGDITLIVETDFSTQDVHVGRLPVYDDVASMNKILSKFISYTASTDTEWRKNALLAMGSHFEGEGEYAILGESTRNQVLLPNGFSTYRLYTPCFSTTFPTCDITGDLPMSFENAGSMWAGSAWPYCQGTMCNSPKQNFGLVFWASHGSAFGAAEMIDLLNPAHDYSGSLDDTHPAFTVSISCNNLSPYEAGNLGTTLLKNGSIAMLGATRVAWPGGGDWGIDPYVYSASSTDVGFGFVKELIDSELTAGEALSALRTHLWNEVLSTMPIPDNTVDSTSFYAWNTLTWWKGQLLLFNLYGDPTIGFENETSSTVTTLPSDTPISVTFAAGETKTFFAENWPSKGDPWWTADVVLRFNSVTGRPIPSGTVWVNGISYSIGGPYIYYQEVNIPDQGPYTVEISESAATTILVTLGNK